MSYVISYGMYNVPNCMSDGLIDVNPNVIADVMSNVVPNVLSNVVFNVNDSFLNRRTLYW